MKDEELDRILSSEPEILPSPGFAASVMNAVREEAVVPPPIPFPWKRLLPGWVAALAGVGVLLAGMILQGRAEDAAEATSMLAPLFQTGRLLGLQWIALAGVVTLVALWFPLRQLGDEGLTN